MKRNNVKRELNSMTLSTKCLEEAGLVLDVSRTPVTCSLVFEIYSSNVCLNKEYERKAGKNWMRFGERIEWLVIPRKLVMIQTTTIFNSL